jgi:hypothetical protein
LDEEDLEELDAKLEMDYQIGEDFKEKVRISLLSPLLSWKLIVSIPLDHPSRYRLLLWEGVEV